MTGLRIAAEALAAIEAGAPAIVLGPGMAPPPAPILGLELRDGVLIRPGQPAARQLPLPGWARLHALLATAADAARLLPLLPAGLPVADDGAALAGLFAGALGRAQRAAEEAAAERDLLRRALGGAEPRARRVIDLPPGHGAIAPPFALALGRPAEGLCGIELHLAYPGRGPLAVRLLAGDRLLGRWTVPEAALAAGWLALDLPEPAPPGPAEARIEIEAEGGDPPVLSLAGEAPALRANLAPPGWSVLPRHFDWTSRGSRLPAQAMPLPATILEAAEVRGADATLVGLGEQAPRLMLELAPGAEASVRLPPLPAAPADLLRVRLVLRQGAGVEASLGLDGAAGAPRPLDPEAGFDLPLAGAATPVVMLLLRHGGAGPAVVELASIALQVGADGEPRRLPVLPLAGLPPALPLRAGRAGPAPPAAPAAARRADAPAPLAAPVSFADLRLHQHLVGADGGYRHLDVGLSALGAGGALWRQARFKLFDRRGIVGLEFREATGWPAMFEAWPRGGSDQFGPFWRLETEGTAAALGALATGRDRALVAAVMEALPGVAFRAAAQAGLGGAETEAWVERARRLSEALAALKG